MIKCPDCGTEFHKLNKSKSNRCPPCRRAWDKAWRSRRKAQGNPVVSTKMPPEYHREYEHRYRAQPEKREQLARNQKRYRNDPALRPRHEARWVVSRAVASGRLQRSPCEVCGNPKTDAHHTDYSKPLDVRWLCRACHAAEHRRLRAEGVAS